MRVSNLNDAPPEVGASYGVYLIALPGRRAAPDAARKKPHSKPTPHTEALKSSGAAWSPDSHEACDT